MIDRSSRALRRPSKREPTWAGEGRTSRGKMKKTKLGEQKGVDTYVWVCVCVCVCVCILMLSLSSCGFSDLHYRSISSTSAQVRAALFKVSYQLGAHDCIYIYMYVCVCVCVCIIKCSFDLIPISRFIYFFSLILLSLTYLHSLSLSLFIYIYIYTSLFPHL